MANKTISRIVVSGTTYDIADVTARGYSHLKNYWTGSSAYDQNTVNLNTRVWFRHNHLFCGWYFNPVSGNYRAYNDGTLSSATTMTNWARSNGALIISTFKVHFQVNSAQNNIHILTGIGLDTDNNTWPAAGTVPGMSMNTQHFKGIANTTFYAGTRYMTTFSQAQWETNTAYWFNGQAYLGNYGTTTLSAYWFSTWTCLTWIVLYRGSNT